MHSRPCCVTATDPAAARCAGCGQKGAAVPARQDAQHRSRGRRNADARTPRRHRQPRRPAPARAEADSGPPADADRPVDSHGARSGPGPRRRLVVSVPRLPRAAAADQLARRAHRRGARRAQHAAASLLRGVRPQPHRRGVRRAGQDLPRRAVRRVQGAPPADAGRPARADRAAARRGRAPWACRCCASPAWRPTT